MHSFSDSITPLFSYAPVVPCVFVLDRSESMTGQPIQMMNQALRNFARSILSDEYLQWYCDRLDICIISFSSEVRTEVGFRPGAFFEAPELAAEGMTFLNQALLHALDMLEARIQEYKRSAQDYYRPAMFVLTDGSATDAGFQQEAVMKMRKMLQSRRMTYVPVALGDADENALAEYYPESSASRPVLHLTAHLFDEFFSWSVPFAARNAIPGDSVEPLSAPSGISISL